MEPKIKVGQRDCFYVKENKRTIYLELNCCPQCPVGKMLTAVSLVFMLGFIMPGRTGVLIHDSVEV